MKLTAYRLAVLGLTNVLTALVFFAVGGGYGQRLERQAKAAEAAEAAKRTVVSNGTSPVTLSDEIREHLRQAARDEQHNQK